MVDKNLVLKKIIIYFYITLIFAIQLNNFFQTIFFNDFIINDDNLQFTIAYNAYKNPELLSLSPSIKYYYELTPIGYKFLNIVFSFFSDNFIIFSKIICFFNYLLTLFIIFAIGRKVKDNVLGIIIFSLCVITPIFLDRIAGGLPRSFAFLLVGIFVLGILMNSVKKIYTAFILSSLFYPPLILNFFLIVIFLYFLNIFRFNLKSFFITIIFCISFIIPTTINSYNYGGYLSTSVYSSIPEADVNCGRITIFEDTYKFNNYFKLFIIEFSRFFNTKNIYIILFLITLLIIYNFFAEKNLIKKTLFSLFICSIISFYISYFLYPKLYIPSRNVTFFLPYLIILSVSNLLKKLPDKFLNILGFLSLFAGLIFLIPSYYGYNYNFEKFNKLYSEIKSSPKNSIYAGLPSPILDGVQLFGERTILVGYETFIPFHKNYLLMQRERMNDNIKILFTEDKNEFHSLINKYKISHILIPEDFENVIKNYDFFCPYTEIIKNYSQNKKPFIQNLKNYKIINNHKIISAN